LSDKPLVVDLDGTLLRTDLLYESIFRFLRSNPCGALLLPLQLLRGKAGFKQYLAPRVDIDMGALPWNTELLDWLRQQRDSGRQMILCTASPSLQAEAVATHLGLFDEVMATEGGVNLGGAEKARRLAARFGQGGFDYVGNSRSDMPVWQCAAEATVVNASASLSERARARVAVTREFPPPAIGASDWFAALRFQQWLKNFLLLAPALAAHAIADPATLLALALAFLSFCLVASGTYLFNDLLDLESDRLHPRKQGRPLAAGTIPVHTAAPAALGLVGAGLVLGALGEPLFLLCLLVYLLLTCCYSLSLKRLVLVDCFALAMLYTLRIIAGAAAIGMGLSFWLLSFSVFLFLSLAFVKRYAEMEVQAAEGRERIHGRGYLISDATLVQVLGISAGYAAALVLSLYLNSEEILLLYRTPEIVWGAVIILLYWISWMWMQAHRGQMHDDPLVFALRDRVSLVCGVLFLAVLWAGTVGWSW